jgi:hypothetical protein
MRVAEVDESFWRTRDCGLRDMGMTKKGKWKGGLSRIRIQKNWLSIKGRQHNLEDAEVENVILSATRLRVCGTYAFAG